MTGADPAFPEYRKIIVDYFTKLAQIGADGVHVDKMFPAAIDYNPNLPMSPDTGPWEGAILLTKEVMASCRKYNPDWAMSFECNWDRMLQFTGATWWVGNQLITRQVFPENAEMLLIGSAYDYLGVNNAVRDGHVAMLGPYNMCRPLGWRPFAGLADYVKEVKRIQDGLTDTVFLGEVLGHDGLQISGEPAAGVAYNVFRSRTTGRRACILTNSRMEGVTQAIQGFDASPNGEVRIHTPFQETKVAKLPAEINIPAEGIVFVEEAAARSETTGGADGSAPRASSTAEQATFGSPITNGGFESGDFNGWTADPNWVIARDSCGYYAGWQGKCWAWSGGKGEAATGKLKSKPFVLDKDKNSVRLLIAGWNSMYGGGKPRKWNYVTLNLADGTELDRVWAPNGTTFVPVMLSGVGYEGQTVYIEAVDDADEATYSMLCIDDVQTVYSHLLKPLPSLPAFKAGSSIKLEDERYTVEVLRSNGAIARILDKKGGIELIREPRLADNFRFTLPIPGKEPWQGIEANYVWGNRQKLSSFKADAKKLTLHWDKPLTNYLGENYDVSATMGIELIPQGVLLTLAIDNATKYEVGEVLFPIVGGVQGVGRTGEQLKATALVLPTAADAASANGIFRVFINANWLGDQAPEQFYGYPKDVPAPWMEFFAAKSNRSVCIGVYGKFDRQPVMRLELIPSNSNTVREDGNWPRPNELKGEPVGVAASFADFPNSPAKKPYRAPSVLISFHDGDWHGADQKSKTGESK
jgi:hypothetical protein